MELTIMATLDHLVRHAQNQIRERTQTYNQIPEPTSRQYYSYEGYVEAYQETLRCLLTLQSFLSLEKGA